MNISGLLLNKTQLNMLKNQNDITKELLKNIPCFNNFDWSKFGKAKKEEFFQIVSSMNVFLSKLPNITNQDFVIFYQTDVTEMDCVFVMINNSKPVFIDVEIKHGPKDKLVDNLKEQLLKRKNEYIPQLFKDTQYLLIGMINDEITMSLYFDGEQDEWVDEKKLINLLSSYDEYSNIGNFLYQVNNMASIVNIFKKIEDGSFKLYEDTKRISESFVKRLLENDKEKGILCYGNAGCGKSVLALKIFNDLKESKILILNPKLYFTLNMSYYYHQGRASYKAYEFLEDITEKDIVIVDECQRLTEKQIIAIVNKCKKFIFFGDEKQSFKVEENLFTMREMQKYINKECSVLVHTKKLTKSRRYSDNVSKIIENLTNDKPVKTSNSDDYKINIYCEKDKFLRQYDSLESNKKMFVPLTIQSHGTVEINERLFSVAPFDANGFSVYENIDPNYVGHTLHALSFDVDDAFVYLPDLHLVKVDRKNKLYHEENVIKPTNVIKFMNELNILFSRGRKSLNIYVDDIRVYLFLKSRIPNK